MCYSLVGAIFSFIKSTYLLNPLYKPDILLDTKETAVNTADKNIKSHGVRILILGERQ